MAETPGTNRGNVKGTILLSRLDLVRGKGGDAMLSAVLSRLPPADREILSRVVLPMGWYAFETCERLDAALALALGGGEVAYRELGARSATDALSTSLRSFARSRDAHGLLKQVAQIHRLYKDTGYMTYEWSSKTRAKLRTFDCKSISASDCLTNLGWLQKAIETCGGQRARVTEATCSARAGKFCEYHCDWVEPPVRPPP